ncbi:MAG: hypothetical protein ACRDHZ_18670, partial [Ktedonobacteraceae bacterium]
SNAASKLLEFGQIAFGQLVLTNAPNDALPVCGASRIICTGGVMPLLGKIPAKHVRALLRVS